MAQDPDLSHHAAGAVSNEPSYRHPWPPRRREGGRAGRDATTSVHHDGTLRNRRRRPTTARRPATRLPPLHAALDLEQGPTLRVSDKRAVTPETPDHHVNPFLATERLLGHPDADHTGQVSAAAPPDREVVQEASTPSSRQPDRLLAFTFRCRAQSAVPTPASGQVRGRSPPVHRISQTSKHPAATRPVPPQSAHCRGRQSAAR